MTRTPRLFPLCMFLMLSPVAVAARWSEPEIAGIVAHGALAETSGMAASRAHPGDWWTINDSGNGAQLQLMDAQGRHRGSVDVSGAENRDWEDLAAFEFEGRPMLLVADTGDNGGIRSELQLHAIEEPAETGRPARVAWTLRFAWPDGPRDCEAIAVDAARGEVLLLSKKRVPPELFRLPLRPPADGGVLVAERLGTLAGVAQPDADDLAKNPVYGRYRAQITSAALSPNGRVLAVLSYRSLHFLVRERGADWTASLAAPVSTLVLPWVPQAEAVAFAPDGLSLMIGSEQLPSPLLRYRVETGPGAGIPGSPGSREAGAASPVAH